MKKILIRALLTSVESFIASLLACEGDITENLVIVAIATAISVGANVIIENTKKE